MGVAEGSARPSLADEAERALRAWLSPGRHRPGDRLPPEHELAAMLGISRGTLRTALGRLELTGEIVRRQGSGTFVGRPEAATALNDARRVDAYSFRARGAEVRLSCAQLRIERRAAGRQAAAALAIVDREPTTVISRTLALDDVPVGVTRDVFHPRVRLPDAPRLRRQLRTGSRMIEVLASSGIAMSFSRTTISSRLLSPTDPRGRRLRLGAVTACMELEEVIHSAGGDPLLYSRDLYMPGPVELEVLQSLQVAPPAPIPIRSDASGAR